jgi:hypothetical protein
MNYAPREFSGAQRTPEQIVWRAKEKSMSPDVSIIAEILDDSKGRMNKGLVLSTKRCHATGVFFIYLI